jgi:hypothetical protein
MRFETADQDIKYHKISTIKFGSAMGLAMTTVVVVVG